MNTNTTSPLNHETQKKSHGCTNTTIMAAFHSGPSPTLIPPSSLCNTWLVLLLGDITGGYLSTAHSQRGVSHRHNIKVLPAYWNLIETSWFWVWDKCLDCVCLKKRNVFRSQDAPIDQPAIPTGWYSVICDGINRTFCLISVDQLIGLSASADTSSHVPMMMIVIEFGASLILQKASRGFYFEDCSRPDLFWASPACYRDFYDLRLFFKRCADYLSGNERLSFLHFLLCWQKVVLQWSSSPKPPLQVSSLTPVNIWSFNESAANTNINLFSSWCESNYKSHNATQVFFHSFKTFPGCQVTLCRRLMTSSCFT